MELTFAQLFSESSSFKLETCLRWTDDKIISKARYVRAKGLRDQRKYSLIIDEPFDLNRQKLRENAFLKLSEAQQLLTDEYSLLRLLRWTQDERTAELASIRMARRRIHEEHRRWLRKIEKQIAHGREVSAWS